jgi:hypothetical protein
MEAMLLSAVNDKSTDEEGLTILDFCQKDGMDFASTFDGRNLLDLAVRNHKPQVASRLLTLKEDFQDTEKNSIINYAITMGYLDVVQYFIKKGNFTHDDYSFMVETARQNQQWKVHSHLAEMRENLKEVPSNFSSESSIKKDVPRVETPVTDFLTAFLPLFDNKNNPNQILSTFKQAVSLIGQQSNSDLAPSAAVDDKKEWVDYLFQKVDGCVSAVLFTQKPIDKVSFNVNLIQSMHSLTKDGNLCSFIVGPSISIPGADFPTYYKFESGCWKSQVYSFDRESFQTFSHENQNNIYYIQADNDLNIISISTNIPSSKSIMPNVTRTFDDGKIFNGSIKNNKLYEGTLTLKDNIVYGHFNDDGNFVIKF